MIKEPQLGLHPINDCVLVELKQSSKNFSIREGKYETRTEGIVIALPMKIKRITFTSVAYSSSSLSKDGITIPDELLGKRVYFEEFKEGARIKRDNKIYSFIKIEDIRGYEDYEQAG